jgi:hypothetical protein
MNALSIKMASDEKVVNEWEKCYGIKIGPGKQRHSEETCASATTFISHPAYDLVSSKTAVVGTCRLTLSFGGLKGTVGFEVATAVTVKRM